MEVKAGRAWGISTRCPAGGGDHALCYRNYNVSGNVQIRIFDSRMQIWNPGILPEGITVDLLKIEHSSRPRNETIASLLFLIGTLIWSH